MSRIKQLARGTVYMQTRRKGRLGRQLNRLRGTHLARWWPRGGKIHAGLHGKSHVVLVQDKRAGLAMFGVAGGIVEDVVNILYK